MSKLENKIVLVTGASVGIGRRIAQDLGARGATVAVNYAQSQAEAGQTVQAVESAGGVAKAYRADVSDAEAVAQMVDEVAADFGRIDVLVNNAGITARMPFDDLDGLDGAMWDRLYDVNVKGAFFCARAVAPIMRKHGEGRIICIGSLAGLRPSGSSIAYCASKAAMTHMALCLAKVLAPEIRVNVVAPGFIDDTRWNQGNENLDALRRQAAEDTPLQRVGYPDDIAEVVVFLAEAANYVTGSTIIVDGGRQFSQ